MFVGDIVALVFFLGERFVFVGFFSGACLDLDLDLDLRVVLVLWLAG